MAPTVRFYRQLGVLLLGFVEGLAACAPCECQNECSRQYHLARNDASSSEVVFTNFGESDDECKIDDVPRSIPGGTRTFIGNIKRRQQNGPGTFHYDIEVTQHHEGDQRESECQGLATFMNADEFTDTHVEEDTSVCVVGEAHFRTLCTEVGCGY